ncbi:MAG TPA: tyrosine-type recombinase/integrase [Solirubrobacteraceae bacterium]|nr:tyrosine-type recombinase/integrase [Solirubrobacteraceae bacterium]
MPAPLVKTNERGIYKRGNRYAVIYRDHEGRQRQESARTLDDARRLKRARQTAADQGEAIAPTRLTVGEYARTWIDGYHGRGHGFRERTRDEYRRDLERYVIPFLGAKRLGALRRTDVREFVAWLVDDQAQAKRHEEENARRKTVGRRPLRTPGPLRDATVSRIVAVVKACLSSAVDDELRRDNPASRVVLPRRDPVADLDVEGDEHVKAFTRAELAVVLDLVSAEWRPLFRLLAGTGLRISEALALDVEHLRLDGSRAHVRVRRAMTIERRDGKVVPMFGHPKSRYGARDLPLAPELVDELRAHVRELDEVTAEVAAKWGRLAFPSVTGGPMDPNNLRRRVLAPATEEADVSWAGFHAFRHSFASLHIERGTNIVRLSRLLGHHKASFTLDVYAHLLDDGLGEPLSVDAELARVSPLDDTLFATR